MSRARASSSAARPSSAPTVSVPLSIRAMACARRSAAKALTSSRKAWRPARGVNSPTISATATPPISVQASRSSASAMPPSGCSSPGITTTAMVIAIIIGI